MNFYEAMNAIRHAEPDARIRMPEMTLMQEFLYVWNEHRRPATLNAEQWKIVIESAKKWMARSVVYDAFQHLLEAGWLSCGRAGLKVAKVSIGAALQSATRTEEEVSSPPHGLSSPPHGLSSPPHGLSSPPHGLPYYVQGTREEVQDSQGARECAQEGERGELGEQALSYARLIPMFEAVFDRTLSRDAISQLARHTREFLEPIAAYYAAPAGDDERRYRRRSFEALMAHIHEERDRAVMWLRSEAGKPYRPRQDVEEWKDLLRALPEDVLPAAWQKIWESHMQEDWRPWSQIGPKSRQAFLACVHSDGMVNRTLAESNPAVARYYVKRWLRQTGRIA